VAATRVGGQEAVRVFFQEVDGIGRGVVRRSGNARGEAMDWMKKYMIL